MNFVPHFMWSWPSWSVELIGGAVLVGLFAWVRPRLARVACAVTLSVVYEKAIDPNGWSWADVGLRLVGIALVEGLWRFIASRRSGV